MSRDAGTASPLHTASAGLCFGQRYNGKDNNVYPGGAAINGGKQKCARASEGCVELRGRRRERVRRRLCLAGGEGKR